MKNTKSKTIKAAAYAFVFFTLNSQVSTAFAQGSLTPPGAPAPTMKTLDQLEPRTAINSTNTPGDDDSLFKITQPGSYYLTGNITGVTGKHGIEIAASGVTLDLNGFDLVGVAGMGPFDGVSATVVGLTNIAVVKGSVRNWGDEGVDLGTSSAVNCRLEGVLARGNAGSGISAGLSSTVTNCLANGNSANGITVVATCTVSNCSAVTNAQHGIQAFDTCSVTGCISTANGFDGIRVQNSCRVTDNICANNGTAGLFSGIFVNGSHNRIEANHITYLDSTDAGISVIPSGQGNFIIRNYASGSLANNYITPAGTSIVGEIVFATSGLTAANNSAFNISN